MTETAVLYHASCPDGWCAAWVAYNALKEQEGVVAALLPVTHGQPAPDIGGYGRVFIVDFAYPHAELVAMAEGRELIVLDHHRTAIEEITAAIELPFGVDSIEFDNQYRAVLDTERSGAGITWDYFWPGRERPPIVDYVEDRDLWRWALPRSRQVNAYLKSQPYALGPWDDIHQHLGVGDMANAGAGVLLQIQAYCRAATTQAYWCEMAGERFPIVNITYESCSDVLDHMLDQFETDMAGYFFRRPDGLWQYGFRGRGGRSVREIAEKFGGGGHDAASGCQMHELGHVPIEAR